MSNNYRQFDYHTCSKVPDEELNKWRSFGMKVGFYYPPTDTVREDWLVFKRDFDAGVPAAQELMVKFIAWRMNQ